MVLRFARAGAPLLKFMLVWHWGLGKWNKWNHLEAQQWIIYFFCFIPPSLETKPVVECARQVWTAPYSYVYSYVLLVYCDILKLILGKKQILSRIFCFLRTAKNFWRTFPFMFNFGVLSNKFPSIFLDKSERGRNLCQHPLQFTFSTSLVSLNLAFKPTTARLLEVFIRQKNERQISYKKFLVFDFFKITNLDNH